MQVVTAQQPSHAPHVLCQVDDGLAGRVAANDDHISAAAGGDLRGRCGVIGTEALEPVATWHLELAIVGPGGDQNTSGGDALTVFEHYHRVGTA